MTKASLRMAGPSVTPNSGGNAQGVDSVADDGQQSGRRQERPGHRGDDDGDADRHLGPLRHHAAAPGSADESDPAMQDRVVAHAAIAERTHIAREVHDVVAHSLTVMMLHLTGARRLLRTDSEAADEALAQAEAIGRASLDAVRQTVGLLRADGTSDAVGPPRPGLGQVDELIERSRAGGLDVTTDLDATAECIAPAVQLVVYRVVQESLSNVLQHGPGATCAVRLRADRLEVVNTPSASPAPPTTRRGLGLVGMAERVRAAAAPSAPDRRPRRLARRRHPPSPEGHG